MAIKARTVKKIRAELVIMIGHVLVGESLLRPDIQISSLKAPGDKSWSFIAKRQDCIHDERPCQSSGFLPRGERVTSCHKLNSQSSSTFLTRPML